MPSRSALCGLSVALRERRLPPSAAHGRVEKSQTAIESGYSCGNNAQDKLDLQVYYGLRQTNATRRRIYHSVDSAGMETDRDDDAV